MKRLLATLFASALLFTGCGLKGGTIIKVNNQKITKSDFNEAYKFAAKNSQLAQMGIDIPENDDNLMYLMIKDRVVNELIVKALVNQEMDKRQIKVTKDELNQERQKMIDKVGSKEKFNEILKQNGISNSKFEKDLEQEIKMKKLVDIIHPVNISEAQAKSFYDKNVAQFKYPDKVRASHILIAANPTEIKEELRKKNSPMSENDLNEQVQQIMKERYNKAVEIKNQVKNHPETFEAIARDVSADTLSAKNGGDIGFFAKKDMVKPFADVAFSQKPNTISDVVQTPYGFHIIKVTDRMAAGQQPFVKVKEQIRMFLGAQEQITALQKFINELKANAVIQYVNSSYDPIEIETKMKKLAAERKANIQQAPQQTQQQAQPVGAK